MPEPGDESKEEKEEKEEAAEADAAEKTESALKPSYVLISEQRVSVVEEIVEIEEKKLSPVTFPTDISNEIQNGHFVEAIKRLRLEKDAANGIRSSYHVLPDSHQEVFVRDARNQQTADVQDTYHDWAIMGINYASAAIKLLEAHGIDTANLSARLKGSTNDFYNKIQTSQDPETDFKLFIHEQIIPAILDSIPDDKKKELNKEVIKKQLAEVRDFCNFDHPTMSVATRTKVQIDAKEEDIYQIDVPLHSVMHPVINNQLKELAAMHKNPSRKQKFDIPWFDNQDPYIQFLIKKHAQDILDGKMIPTQLRKYFPGIRNAGEEYLVNMGNKEIIHRHYHSGTPAHLLKAGSQEATNESIAQLEESSNAQHVFVLTLLSPLFHGFGHDAGLVDQVEKAVNECNQQGGKGNFHVSNIPLNFIRGGIASRNMSGADWLVNQAREKKKALEFDEDVDKESEKLANKLDNLIKQYEKLKSGSGFFWDRENRNLQLVSVINQLAHAVNDAHRHMHPDEKDFVAVVSSCQSGKDRAGLARMKTVVDSLVRYFKVGSLKGKSSAEESIRAAQINAGHVAIQAGLQGGTIGASGIKKDSLAALPASWKKWKSAIFKKTASYNKGIPEHPGKPKVKKAPAVHSTAGIMSMFKRSSPKSAVKPLLAAHAASGELKEEKNVVSPAIAKALGELEKYSANDKRVHHLELCYEYLDDETVARQFLDKITAVPPDDKNGIIQAIEAHYPKSAQKERPLPVKGILKQLRGPSEVAEETTEADLTKGQRKVL